jgi:hypothetical protein
MKRMRLSAVPPSSGRRAQVAELSPEVSPLAIGSVKTASTRAAGHPPLTSSASTTSASAPPTRHQRVTLLVANKDIRVPADDGSLLVPSPSIPAATTSPWAPLLDPGLSLNRHRPLDGVLAQRVPSPTACVSAVAASSKFD